MTAKNYNLQRANVGNIFYSNLGQYGNKKYWASVGVGANSYFSQVNVATAPGTQTANFLRSMGLAELEKEKKLLIDYFGVNAIDWNEDNFKELILAMNKALNLEGVFARVVERLNSEDNRAQERDTTIASVYGEHLDVILQPRLDAFFDNSSIIESIVFGNMDAVGKAFEEMVKTAMDDALTSLLQSQSDAKRGNTDLVWQEALNAINQVEDFRRDFGVEFFGRYGFEKVKKSITDDIKKGLDYEALRDKVAQQYKQKISGSLNLQTTTGYVARSLGQAFQMASTKNIQWRSSDTGSKGYSANKVTVFGEGEVDFTMLTAATKMDAAKNVQAFHQKMVDGMAGSTVIYENTRKATLGKNFRGFSGGTRPLDSIEAILDKVGYQNADAFINKIKQTMGGAIYSGSGFKELAEESLAAIVAYLLFDDIDTIGDSAGDSSAIHIFRLSDIVLPLSFLLISLGDAMADAEGNIKDYVQVSISIPDSVIYGYSQPDRSQDASEERWLIQANQAAKQSTVTINFLSGFKSIIGSLF